MSYYKKETINQVKKIDLYSYLKSYKPEELVHESRNTFHTATHDSLKINNGMWYWFSRGIGGRTALEYLIQVEGYSFTEAVGHLLNLNANEKSYVPKEELTEKEKIDRLILPPKATSNYKVVAYLHARGISVDIINECIDKGLIYQESLRNNVVFVGLDEGNIPRYAGIRGTNSSRYMGDASGSDKAYSFRLDSVIKNNSVHLFESAIDLLSYATLKELKGEQWDEENLLSLAGVYSPKKDVFESKVPKTVANYLKNNPNIDTIILHFDNDNAGRLATIAIQTLLSDSYKVINDSPKEVKDVNDVLKKQLGISIKSGYEIHR